MRTLSSFREKNLSVMKCHIAGDYHLQTGPPKMIANSFSFWADHCDWCIIKGVLRAFKRKGPPCFEVSYCLGQVTWRQHLQCICYFFGLHLVRGCLFGGRVWDLTSSNQLLDKGKCWLSPTCQTFILSSKFLLRKFYAEWEFVPSGILLFVLVNMYVLIFMHVLLFWDFNFNHRTILVPVK